MCKQCSLHELNLCGFYQSQNGRDTPFATFAPFAPKIRRCNIILLLLMLLFSYIVVLKVIIIIINKCYRGYLYMGGHGEKQAFFTCERKRIDVFPWGFNMWGIFTKSINFVGDSVGDRINCNKNINKIFIATY